MAMTDYPAGVSVTVTCRTHGPMRYDLQWCAWRCHGWDGEGCSALTDEAAVASIGPLLAGTTRVEILAGFGTAVVRFISLV